jgi:phage gpG-like protein
MIVKFRVDLQAAKAKLTALGKGANSRETLSAIGDRILGYVDSQFQTGGGGQWARNKPNTIEKKGHGTVLVQSGKLKNSWRKRIATGYSVTVYSTEDQKATFAHEGTEPHVITASGRALRFPVVGGMKFAFAVNHPGTPARPILPTGDYAKLISEVAGLVNARITASVAGK